MVEIYQYKAIWNYHGCLEGLKTSIMEDRRNSFYFSLRMVIAGHANSYFLDRDGAAENERGEMLRETYDRICFRGRGIIINT